MRVPSSTSDHGGPVILSLHVAPRIADSAWLAPGSYTLGDVSLGQDCSVWYGAVLRADLATITVGDRSNLQDNVTVHADPSFPVHIGHDVTVGHGAVLHGCTVEDHALIGMGATVLNGAHIGEGSIVAAGALVPEGFIVPPSSLVVGCPGRVRRPVTDQERVRAAVGTASYVDSARRHRAALENRTQ